MILWAIAVVLVLGIGAIAVVAAGHGSPLAPAYDDRPDVLVPGGRDLTGDDLRALRFSTVVRGYRASEVDALLARLADELAARGGGAGPADRAD